MPTPPTPEPTDRPVGSSLVALHATPAIANLDDAPTIIKPQQNLPPTDPSLGLAPGSILGHFELIASVGAGGMAAVLKARDNELGRLVALKILPPHMARDPDNVTRFKHEARAAAKLDHDNVARVFFCGEDRGLHFIAFEFVEGDSLKALIDQRGTLAPSDVVRIGLHIAAGLAHAAERGVVHRDVKPSNIMIDPDGKAKLVDMGLARNLFQAINGGVTQSGVTLGTFDYISPEQALDPRRADVRSDIYSLGCTLYHALTGRAPVPDGTAAKKLHHHQYEPITDPRVLNPQVPDDLAAVLSTMMAKDPARRYQSPADLIAALASVGRALHLTAESLALDPAMLNASAKTDSSRWSVGLIAGLVVAVVAVIAVSLSLTGSPRPANPPPWDDGGQAKLPTPIDPLIPVAPSPANPASAAIVVAGTAEDLVRLLKDPAVAEVRLEPGRKYDLTAVTDSAQVVGKKSITLDTLPGSAPAILRVAAMPTDSPTFRTGAMTISGAEVVRFRGIRFVIADGPTIEVPAERPVAVWVHAVGRVEISECRFEADKDLASADVVGLAVEQEGKEPTTCGIRYSYFGVRRGVGLRLAGRVRAEVIECGFAPHPAAIGLKADADPAIDRGELVLRHCAFLLDKGAGIEAEDGARWTVTAGFSAFGAVPPTDPAAAMMMTDPSDHRPMVLRVLGDPPYDDATFAGRANEPNAYYRVDAFAAGGKGYAFAEAAKLVPIPTTDPSAAIVTVSPWAAADPIADLAGPEPRRALKLKTTLPAVRVPGDVILGIRYLTAAQDKVYDLWPPPALDLAANPKVKVWWPSPPADAADSLPKNVFADLDAAVAALKPGDELHIRATGLVRVPPTNLTKPKLRVVIRPEPGSMPILTPADSNYFEPSLFRMVDGDELIIDGFDIRLRAKPVKPGAVRSVAVVTVVGDRKCTVRNCAITCEPTDDEVLTAVALADPTGGEMLTRADGRATVRIENSLIRGKGRAVWAQAARPFELTILNSVTALAGPVIAIDPPVKAAPLASTTRIRLDRLTAALAGPLCDLHPGKPVAGPKPIPWIPVEIDTDRCLFAITERGHPFIALDGGDPATPLKSFGWTVHQPNWYANFSTTAVLLDVLPADDSATRTFDADDWFALVGEKRSTGRVTFAASAGTLKKPANLTAADLTPLFADLPGAGAADAGADPKTVARPTDDR